MSRIYFDNNATTPVATEVKEAILPFLEDNFGNPSSAHRLGENALGGVDRARDQVAELLNTFSSRIFFTSGGTESNNLAILGAAWSDPGRKHIISSLVEHASVLQPLAFLADHGYEIELLDVDNSGGLDLDLLAQKIRPDTALVSLMGANNETGVIWPLKRIGELCRERGVLFHTDAVQMLGKVKIDLKELPIDYLSIAGHKLHGPKGIGALYASRSAPLSPVVRGAGQEKGVRPGTENTPGIAGLGAACQLAASRLDQYQEKVMNLKNKLEDFITEKISDAIIIGQGQERLVNTSNICFRYCSSAALIQELDEKGIAVSGHSACHSGDLDPSHVLSAMRVPETHLHGALRISFSIYNTEDELDRMLDLLPGIVEKTRLDFAD